jgi:hypothetical protein
MKNRTRMIDVITSLGQGSARRTSRKSNNESHSNQVGFYRTCPRSDMSVLGMTACRPNISIENPVVGCVATLIGRK